MVEASRSITEKVVEKWWKFSLKMFHRKRELHEFSRNSLISLVPEAGLEPAQRYTPRDFKSLVSTNSTTRA